MDLADPRIQRAIIDIAETSESTAVAAACRLVIADYLEQGDTKISSPREVILIALECVALQQAIESSAAVLARGPVNVS